MTIRKKVTKPKDLAEQFKIFTRLAENPNNTPEQQARYNNTRDNIELKLMEQRLKSFAERKAKLVDRVTITHGSYDDWYKWAMSLYKIAPPRTGEENTTANYKVISNAAKWKEEKSWEEPDEISCFEKIEMLITYKDYDHHQRKDRG